MKSNNPLVSVIITTKNSERTLDKCLNSIKQQSYKNIEIIVVDLGLEGSAARAGIGNYSVSVVNIRCIVPPWKLPVGPAGNRIVMNTDRTG